MLRVSFKLFSCLLVTALANACSEGSTTPDGNKNTGPSLRVIAGANQRDTIQTQLSQQLVVEVRGTNGEVVAGAIVQFEALGPTDPARVAERAIYVCRSGVQTCDETAADGGRASTDTSDIKGQASALIRLGTVAGTARIVASVTSTALADTSSFVVTPGAIKRIDISVRDSSVYVGGSYRFGPSARDRLGNVIESAIDYTLIGNGVVLENGDRFRATSLGRAGAVVRIGALVDTAWITVPPRGTLAVFDVGGPDRPQGVAKVELDGSGYRLIAQTADTYYGTFPNWTSTGSVLFESGNIYGERMYVTDTLGSRQRVTAATTVTVGEIFGAGSPGGSIYFSAAGSSLDYGTGIWRVTTPGTDPVRVGPNPSGNANAWKVSPAPDGKQLAYSDVNRGGVTLLDVATGTPHSIVAQADMPRWSPLGDWILFNADTTLYRVRPDGSGRTRVGPIRFYNPRGDWSPDGDWVIARGRNRLELINVTTQEALPLGWSARFIRPVWKP